MTSTKPCRQPLPGSCACGLTTYILFLTLPHPFSSTHPPRPTDQEIYRCNCSACHKLSLFHVHPAHPRSDFFLLSPLDPDHDLSTYTCNSGKLKFYFCPKCGVRCFTFRGEGEVRSIDTKELGVEHGEEGGRREVWQAKWEGEKEDARPYVSVNGCTIDDREGWDMRVLTEEKRVQYFDDKSEPVEAKKDARWERPHWGGCY